MHQSLKPNLAQSISKLFMEGSGAAPTISNGTIGIGSNTTIEGFNFVDASITNYSTSNVRIAGNSFKGSANDWQQLHSMASVMQSLKTMILRMPQSSA